MDSNAWIPQHGDPRQSRYEILCSCTRFAMIASLK
jgi:hypothetical protein